MTRIRCYWGWVAAAIAFRLLLICFPKNLNLGSRPEVATPLTSLRRWSMYHGSPLLLSLLGPLAITRSEGQPAHFYCSLMFVIVDFVTAMLIHATGQKLMTKCHQSLQFLNLSKLVEASGNVDAGKFASLLFLWNPLTIVTCVGSTTTPIDNLMVVLAIYGACSRLAPLAAFGWVIATHLSLYPVILIVPLILLLCGGLDAPPSKLFQQKNNDASGSSPSSHSRTKSTQTGIQTHYFSWRPVLHFLLWASIWSCYVLFLSSISLKGLGGLSEMFKKTHGFILTVEDLSPNIGVLWYFFAEVFDFFRNFFLIVFNMNILYMLLPLAIRLKHRPCFLAFVYLAISSMLKSYPSVGDAALYLGLLGLFANELAGMQFSFFLFCGYIGVSLLSPVMHNLWIWRTVLVVESVSTMLKYDRMLRKHITT